jgi:hypothetical protein
VEQEQEQDQEVMVEDCLWDHEGILDPSDRQVRLVQEEEMCYLDILKTKY